MTDPLFSRWPSTNDRKVVSAEAQLVSKPQRLYRIEFTDSAGKKLTVQLSEAELHSIVETGDELLST